MGIVSFRSSRNNFVLLSELEMRLRLFEHAHPTQTVSASEYGVIHHIIRDDPFKGLAEAECKRFDHFRYLAISSMAKGVIDVRKQLLHLYEHEAWGDPQIKTLIEEYISSDDEELCAMCCIMENLNRVVIS